MKFIEFGAPWLFAAMVFPACSDTAGSAGAGGSIEPQHASLLLHVLDSSGAPIPSAAVTVQGATQPTDGAGYIYFDNLAPGRFVAKVESWGYAPASAVVELPAGVHGGTEVHLLSLGTPIPFDATSGAVLDQGPIRVSIPPAGLVDHNGESVTGTVEATIVPFDPTQGLDNLPGPLEGVTQSNGELVELESLFMAEVTLWQNGLPVQLAPGQPAVIEMLLPDSLTGQYQEGQTIPAWWFDLDAGLWREEGLGTIQVSSADPSKLGWVVPVEHFTWWNCDEPWTDKHCFDVLVTDSTGAPVPYMQIDAVGFDYRGLTRSEYTHANGHACVDIKRDGTAKIRVGSAQSPLATTIVTGMGPAANCRGNGGACTPVTVVIPNNTVCEPGESEPCGTYSGPAGTGGVGICRAGTKYCNVTGTGWTGCEGHVLPKPEDCNSPFDDDCDGLVNEEGTGCLCDPGSSMPCYTGPAGTINVGICKGGTRTCQNDGKGYGACLGQVLPMVEACASPEDENCDGSTSCGGTAIWSKRFGDGNSQIASSMATDSAGNVVITGIFDGLVDFGGGPIVVGTNLHTFMAKFDANGNHLWSKGFKGSIFSARAYLAVDGSGNVMLAGQFADTVDFGGGLLTTAGGPDVFVAKFDPNGNHLWSKRFGDIGEDSATSIAVDSAGNPMIAGYFGGTVNFGGGSLTSAGFADIFVAKFNANGNHLWSKRFGHIGHDSATSIAVDSADNLVIAGNFGGTVDFGGGPLTSVGAENIVVAKFDSSGNHLWSKGFQRGQPKSVAVDTAGNVVLAGYFTWAVDLGGEPLTTVGGGGIFVAKFDPNGNHLWSKAFEPSTYGQPNSMAVDTAGNVVLAGYFAGIVDFGGGPLTNPGPERNIFVAKFGPNGTHLWSKGFGDGSGDEPNATAIDTAGNVVLTGQFLGPLDFGTGLLVNSSPGAGTYDIFLAKLTP